MMMMMMMIITVPKSYVVSGLPLWCNKDDFTLTEPSTCYRTFPLFLPPDSQPPDATPFFLFSPCDPASWRPPFNYNCLVSVVSCVEPPGLRPSQFSSYGSFPGFLTPEWRPSIAPFLFTFTFVFIAGPSSIFFSSPDSIRLLPFYLVAFVQNLLVCRISVHFLYSYYVAHVLH